MSEQDLCILLAKMVEQFCKIATLGLFVNMD